MKTCQRCGTPWSGHPGRPQYRSVCGGCGGYLHTCLNCRHFDRKASQRCVLAHTRYVGPKDQSNYCDEFVMVDGVALARQDKASQARQAWHDLFRR